MVPVIAIDAPLLAFLRAVRKRGGRGLVVGGSVRDALLGHPSKDVDVEVHGLDADALVEVLGRFGNVNEVGRSFGVFKLRLGGREVDVSLPRRDSKAGAGHKGIRAEADPGMGVVEAARRRDLTINAIAYDPLDEEWIDPFGGRADLGAGVLRAVDPTTFVEDPLRALRVAQFAARFDFVVDPALEAICRDMALHELPSERIRGEVDKLLLKGRRPSVGWAFAERAGLWEKVLPEWGAGPPRLDAVAAAPIGPEPRRLALLYAAACGRNDVAEATSVLDRLRVFRTGGYAVRPMTLFLVASREEAERGLDATRIRTLAEDGDLELLSALVGDPGLFAEAERLGVAHGPLPALLAGRDLVAMGVPAGARMGELLAQLRSAQLAGQVATPEEARALVARWLQPESAT